MYQTKMHTQTRTYTLAIIAMIRIRYLLQQDGRDLTRTLYRQVKKEPE